MAKRWTDLEQNRLASLIFDSFVVTKNKKVFIPKENWGKIQSKIPDRTITALQTKGYRTKTIKEQKEKKIKEIEGKADAYLLIATGRMDYKSKRMGHDLNFEITFAKVFPIETEQFAAQKEMQASILETIWNEFNMEVAVMAEARIGFEPIFGFKEELQSKEETSITIRGKRQTEIEKNLKQSKGQFSVPQWNVYDDISQKLQKTMPEYFKTRL